MRTLNNLAMLPFLIFAYSILREGITNPKGKKMVAKKKVISKYIIFNTDATENFCKLPFPRCSVSFPLPSYRKAAANFHIDQY